MILDIYLEEKSVINDSSTTLNEGKETNGKPLPKQILTYYDAKA